MRKISFFVILLLLSIAPFAGAQNMKIGSYNLRYDNKGDAEKGNGWVERSPALISLIRFHDFDVFGTQEGLKNQLDDISNALPQYARYGIGRDDGKDKGEHSAIFYKKDEFKLLANGDFWLSETPDTPSLGWDATCCNRICSWVKLQHKESEKTFYFFNVHYDHQGIVARRESSKLILKKIKDIAGEAPVILTGDFNGSTATEWYKTIANSDIVKDTYDQVQYPYANNSSFNNFGFKNEPKDIIDHVFVSDQFQVKSWGLLTDTYFGKFPSDHFPVLVKVSL